MILDHQTLSVASLVTSVESVAMNEKGLQYSNGIHRGKSVLRVMHTDPIAVCIHEHRF